MVQLLYCHSAVPILQIFPVIVLSQCSFYTTKRSSYCIVAVQFLYYKMVQLLYCHNAVLILKMVQFLCCHSAVTILQKGPVTVLSQCSSYTTKRCSYCIVTVQFLYYKTIQLLYCRNAVLILKMVQLLYCHSAIPILIKVQLLYCHSVVPILQNVAVTVLLQCSSYTTKLSSYSTVAMQFLY